MTTGPEVPPLSAEEIAIDSLRKACACLYLEVPTRIADDVRNKANAVISQLRAAQPERVELEAKVRVIEGRRVAHEALDALIDAGLLAIANNLDYALGSIEQFEDALGPDNSEPTMRLQALGRAIYDIALQSAQKENE